MMDKFKNTMEDSVKDLKRENAEQKAEIARLKEENESRKELLKIYIKEKVELSEENAKLQKQVDELKVYLASEKVCSKQAVRDTTKDLLIEFNEWINGHYDAKLDTYSVHIPVHEVNNFLTDKAKEYGLEVK